jgi:hypothetical protein
MIGRFPLKLPAAGFGDEFAGLDVGTPILVSDHEREQALGARFECGAAHSHMALGQQGSDCNHSQYD